MRNLFYLIICCVLASSQFCLAQTDFQLTDSISNALLKEGKWGELFNYGNTAVAKGDDFPNLRLRMGFAAFSLGNYSAALQNYEQVLKTDRFNQTALYYAYLCNVYLNRPKEASYFVAFVDGKTIDGKVIKPVDFTTIGAETVFKFTDNLDRGNASFNRVNLQLRAGYKFHVDYSVSLFNQDLQADPIRQIGSYVKLSYALSKNLGLLGAWNYSSTNYLQTDRKTNTVLFGLKYHKPFYQLGATGGLTRNNGNTAKQVDLQLINYLIGNLNFYLSNRLTYLSTSFASGTPLKSLIYNPNIGLKVIRNLWTEVGGTFGQQFNYTEVEALYQYNGLDLTTFKGTANAYLLLKKQVVIGLGYALEKKTDNSLNFDYLQHGINANITWNF